MTFSHTSPAWHLGRRDVFDALRLPLFAVRYVLDGDALPAHDHDFCELVFVADGAGKHITADGAHSLAAGDALVLRPGAWHTFAECAALEVYNCCFGAELLAGETALGGAAFAALRLEEPAGGRGAARVRLPPDEFALCVSHLAAMAACGAEGAASPLAATDALAYLLLLLGRVARHMEPHAARARPPLPDSVREARRLLDADMARAWTLPELAASVFCTPAHLSRSFRAHLGVSPLTHLARRRADAAARLLLQTQMAVGEIGACVGWPDGNLFARRFRQHYGLSASAYRARLARRAAPA